MLKLILQTSNWSIPLTWAQWAILEIKYENEERFPQRIYKDFNVEKFDFNGHFGRAVFFQATAADARKFKKYLSKYLETPESYKFGFKHGESGADCESDYAFIEKEFYEAGWEDGRNGRKS